MTKLAARALVSLFLAAWANQARAQDVSTRVDAPDASTQAEGRALFDEGMRLFNQAAYDQACPKFEASLKRYPGLGTRGKLAECYEKQGRTASAWATYKEVAALATRAGDTVRADVANERANRLEPNLAKLVVRLPAQNDVPGLAIAKDGRPLERAVLGTPVNLDPGPVLLVITAPGRQSKTLSVTVEPGKTVTAEIPALELAQAEPVPSRPAETAPPARRAWQKPVGLGLAGAGVVSLAVGSILGLSANSTYNEAFDSGECDSATNQCSTKGQDQVDSARTQATWSTVLFVAGAVLGGGGAALYFVAPDGQSAAGVEQASARLCPWAGTHEWGLSVSGRL